MNKSFTIVSKKNKLNNMKQIKNWNKKKNPMNLKKCLTKAQKLINQTFQKVKYIEKVVLSKLMKVKNILITEWTYQSTCHKNN